MMSGRRSPQNSPLGAIRLSGTQGRQPFRARWGCREMIARVEVSRFPGLSSRHLQQCSPLSPRVLELASTFPLLFFMVVRGCGPVGRRLEAVRRAELGNPLGDVAEVYGLPLCLRRIPAEACITPPPWVRWSRETGALLADYVPKSPSDIAHWLAATFAATRACNEAFGLWIARQRQWFIGYGFDAKMLQPLALYAWHSCERSHPLHQLAVKPWTPKLGI